MDDHLVPLGLPSKVLCALIDHTGEIYFGPKSEAALCEAIKRWIAGTGNAVAAPAAAQPAAPQPAPPPVTATDNTSRGYQWKQLFLPNGTELRTIYCGQSLYATVENEQILIDGVPTTPSRLANRQGCGSRNAWKTIWLRLPGNKRWELAARCRGEQP
ncbi:hypothetical protein GTP45_22920 [Pseudoduganella sp. FT55W]|uniref:Uncharacterized protein n=1 Tax=Duganella rivi TaxID=2666083 RepID=A0A7X4GW38_9BURK|nr:hypothetical protein [Duganella rivi]MYM69674.1 hypothetical protein [Duganella rivi]